MNTQEAFPRFTSGEYARRAKALRRILEENSVKAVIIAGGLGSVANLYYWTNYLARSQSFFVTTDGLDGTLFVGNYNHIPTAEAMAVVDEKKIVWATHSPRETVSKELAEAYLDSSPNNQKIGVIGNLLYEIGKYIESSLDYNILNLTKYANEVRAIKSEEEVQWLKKGAEFTDKAVESLESDLKLGMTEFDICEIVERAYVRHGGTTRIHYISSTSMQSPQVFVPWQNQQNRRLKKGDIVLTEISAEYAGYAGQIHRPITIVDGPTKIYSELFRVALETYERVRSKLVHGSTTKDVVKASETIVKGGYTICDSLVHGFGVDLMFPDIGTSNSVYENPEYTFNENMAVVIQPNPITPDKKFGLQVGNLCLVGKKRTVSLQKYPLRFITAG